MLRMYRGPNDQIQSRLLEMADRHARAFVLYDKTDMPYDWSGVRSILAMAYQTLGKAHCDRVVSRHRAVVACACPELPLDMNTEDRAEYDHIRARVYTHSNRNHQMCGHGAAMLADLLGGKDVALFLPNPDRFDFISFSIIKNLFTYHRERAPECHIGIPELDNPATCSRAISWAWNQDSLENEVAGFLLAADSKVVSLEGGGPVESQIPAGIPDPDHLFGPMPEREAYDSLLAAKELDAVLYERVYQAVESSFRRHSFRTSIRLALALLDRAHELGANYMGRIQALTGTVAHFYHFSHEPNQTFDKFLEACFRGALTADLDPEFRLACWFRLMFTIAERMDDPQRAKPDLDLYMAELAAADMPPLRLAYQGSWANFICCYITAHVGTKEAAEQANHTAYQLLVEGSEFLAEQPEGERRYWDEELSLCRFNLAAHSVYLGERLRWFDFNRYWYEVAEPLTYGQPKAVHFEVYHWVHHNRFILNYEEALRRAELGIADAKTCCHGGMHYIFLFSAADLCDRMGRPAQAADYLERAIAACPRTCNLFQVASHQYLLAKAQFRAGLDAMPAFELALRELDAKDLNGQFSARGFLAQIAARGGRIEEAESILNQLIEDAQESGLRDLIVTVLLHVADACDWLDRREDAVAASRQAWDILNDSFDESVKARQVAAALRRLPAHTIAPEQMGRLVKPFRKELNYGDAWWLLKDFLKLAYEASQVEPELFADPDLTKHLEFLSAAATTREDCAPVLVDLRESPGQENIWPVERPLAGIGT